MFDTFLGNAVTGPLADKKKLKLKQASVITTDWGTWKKAHPETTVLVEALALGRNFDFPQHAEMPKVRFFRSAMSTHGCRFTRTSSASSRPSGTAGGVSAKQGSRGIEKRRREIAFENVRLELAAGGIKAVGADGSRSWQPSGLLVRLVAVPSHDRTVGRVSSQGFIRAAPA